jgi:hypothetical protein
MVQGSDNGKHETHDAISMAQCGNASIARPLLAIAPSPERCL